MGFNTLNRSLDFIMMTFGERNVFSTADACTIISRCALRLEPRGRLLTEVHTFEEVKRQGITEANGHTTRFGSQMMALRNDEYFSLLDNVGFTLPPPPERHDWPVSETFEGKLFALLAEKAKKLRGTSS